MSTYKLISTNAVSNMFQLRLENYMLRNSILSVIKNYHLHGATENLCCVIINLLEKKRQ